MRSLSLSLCLSCSCASLIPSAARTRADSSDLSHNPPQAHGGCSRQAGARAVPKRVLASVETLSSRLIVVPSTLITVPHSVVIPLSNLYQRISPASLAHAFPLKVLHKNDVEAYPTRSGGVPARLDVMRGRQGSDKGQEVRRLAGERHSLPGK